MVKFFRFTGKIPFREIKNAVIIGDNLRILSKFPSNSVDCVVTSPPYNLKGDFHTSRKKKGEGKSTRVTFGDYTGFSDILPEDEYQTRQVQFLNECYRILKDGRFLFYVHKNRKINYEEVSPLSWIVKSEFKVFQTIYVDYRSTANVDKRRCFPVYELCFVLVKGEMGRDIKLNNEENLIDVWNLDRNDNYWVGFKKRPRKETGHPATFAFELARRCIILGTNPGDLILDPYAGTGTTLIESYLLNRPFIGLEISPIYARLIQKNFKRVEFFKKKRKKEN